jgi:putative N6-adenine-specific DNA methylase
LDQSYLAKTFHGLEDLLAQELTDLGAAEVRPVKRAVHFSGDQRILYQANLWLRTALRVLVPIHQFEARDEGGLYRGVQAIAWGEYLTPSQTLAVDTVVHSAQFTHGHYVALKAKDAIVDQFRQQTGRRPSVDTDNPDLRIHLHVNDVTVRVLLDSSGESLHRRGYRLAGRRAPLNEVLANGLLRLSGWTPEQPLLDPMCGSGTIPIEATLISANIAPGLLRQRFGFQLWRDYDQSLWANLRREARAARRSPLAPILGRDLAPAAINAAQANARRAQVQDLIDFAPADFLLEPAPEVPGWLIMNPPYGERLGEEDQRAFYRSIGDRFKQAYAGHQAWVISSNLPALKALGLKPAKKHTLYNGPLLCKFQGYELYAGTRA